MRHRTPLADSYRIRLGPTQHSHGQDEESEEVPATPGDPVVEWFIYVYWNLTSFYNTTVHTMEVGIFRWLQRLQKNFVSWRFSYATALRRSGTLLLYSSIVPTRYSFSITIYLYTICIWYIYIHIPFGGVKKIRHLQPESMAIHRPWIGHPTTPFGTFENFVSSPVSVVSETADATLVISLQGMFMYICVYTYRWYNI